MKKHPNSKMIEGMEALRSIAATSMFLQNEKTNTNSSENASNQPIDYSKYKPTEDFSVNKLLLTPLTCFL